MADKRRRHRPISKGMKLPVLVEEAIEDVLIVCLEAGSKTFRGVLMDAGKRNLPHGVCFPFKTFGKKDSEENGDSSAPPSDGKDKNVELSASSLRHSYNTDFSQFDEKVVALTKRTYTRHFRDKTVRNIRLRPRQILCSKCKATCHDNDKTNQSSSSIRITPAPTSYAPPHQPRQPASPPPTPPPPSSVPPQELSDLKTEGRKRKITEPEQPAPLDKVSAKTEGQQAVVKSSPVIKISVGEGTVLKISPRIHSEVVDTDLSSEEKGENKEDHTSHKRLKKAMKKAKEKMKKNDSENGDKIPSGHHRKHKRKHKHKHACADIDRNLPPLLLEKSGCMKGGENESENEQVDTEMIGHHRPRLLYTWRRNSGLSKVESDNSSVTMSSGDSGIAEKDRKDSLLDASLEMKSNSSLESADGINSHSMNGISDSNSDYDDDSNQFPSGNAPAADSLKPLMMKIQTKNMTKCETTEGKIIHVGDIVWGKIQGFPWWPGRVLSITVSMRDSGVVIAQLAHVSWFGSSTMSHMQCSDLYPFLEYFKLRHNKKKRGPYKLAIKQATIAAQTLLGNRNLKIEELEVGLQ